MRNNFRVLEIDLCRTICVLWIVAVWHMYKMLPENVQPSFKGVQTLSCITGMVLACFTFLSGYFLKKYTFSKPKDVYFFYKKRLIRFYILFIIASFGVFMAHYHVNQISLYFSTIFGVSLIIPPTMWTMWYFSMLMLFYLATPLLMWKKTYSWKLITSGIIFFCFLLMVYYFDSDIRLLWYFPFYVFGLCLPENIFSFIKRKVISIPLIIISATLVFFCAEMYSNSSLIRLLINMMGVFSIIGLCFLLYHPSLSRFVVLGGYASMCIYLFHRVILAIGIRVLGEDKYNGHIGLYSAFLLIVVYFISGYYIQRIYDYCLEKWLK